MFVASLTRRFVSVKSRSTLYSSWNRREFKLELSFIDCDLSNSFNYFYENIRYSEVELSLTLGLGVGWLLGIFAGDVGRPVL